METNSVLIIGAGLSGLTAARILADAGIDVALVDKGRGVGGRAATRRLERDGEVVGRWDHGAQFTTFRSRDLVSDLRRWGAWDLLSPWCSSHGDPDILRRCPPEGVNQFAKRLAEGLTVHNGHRILRLRREKHDFLVESDQGNVFRARTILCTLPAPQLLDLLLFSDLAVDRSARDLLTTVSYERTLALMAELNGPSGLPEPGHHRAESGVIHTVIDQVQKGISQTHTVTAHATPAFSLEWYDRDRNTAASVMRAALRELVASNIVSHWIHGWKFSKPLTRVPRPWLELSEGLFACGDGYEAGDEDVPADFHPRIESAMLSGAAAARELAGRLTRSS